MGKSYGGGFKKRCVCMCVCGFHHCCSTLSMLSRSVPKNDIEEEEEGGGVGHS